MDVWIGTSGYSYPDWVGPFYPPGTKPNRMLAHYARHFPLVELNFSFYGAPTPSALAKLADAAPDGFRFLVKMPRTISHDERPDDLPGFRLALEQMARRGRLLGVLLQLPQAHHDTRRRRAWLEQVGQTLDNSRVAVEFRHRSWAKPDVAGWLAAHRLDLVAVDAPDIAALYPSGLVQSTDRIYIRFHSRTAENWYASDKERYDYDYPDDALAGWIDALTAASGTTREALMLFNNCMRGQAIENARRAAELIRRAASPELTLVEPPPPPPGTVQGSLFGEG